MQVRASLSVQASLSYERTQVRSGERSVAARSVHAELSLGTRTRTGWGGDPMGPAARIRAIGHSVRELMERLAGTSSPTRTVDTHPALPSATATPQPAATSPQPTSATPQPAASAPPQPLAVTPPQPTIAAAPTARDVASQLAKQATFVSTDGSSRALTSSQQEALASALSRYSADQLSSLRKANVTYHIVDGQHPPSFLGWPAGVRGSYDNGTQAIYLAERDLAPAAIHETAHALDDVGSSGLWASTNDPAVTQAYKDYLARVSGDPSKDWNAGNGGYARTTLQEFTAEAARAILESDASRARIASLDPETCQAVGRLLQLNASLTHPSSALQDPVYRHGTTSSVPAATDAGW